MEKWYLSPDYWRTRAAEAAELARHLEDPVARASMLTVAEDYQKIAARYEQNKVFGQSK